MPIASPVISAIVGELFPLPVLNPLWLAVLVKPYLSLLSAEDDGIAQTVLMLNINKKITQTK